MMHYLPWILVVAVVAFLVAIVGLKVSEDWFVNHKVVYFKRRRKARRLP
ncbi:MAG: hypothetical protein NTZ90_18180 [Proteobacteria bacterium]|jgi:hypothetical protein|nr:hypothetical protein [Pseudomonadota bacterium]